jgi:hypothetical protein
MQDGEFYSPADLGNTLEEPICTIVQVLKFLEKYKFIERITKRELIFRKIPTGPSPATAATILRMVRANAALNDANPVANVPKTYRRFDLP